MAEMPRLENTMVNNLGTTLRKLRKLKRAVALHRQHLAHVEATQGLHSQFLILARHNLVEALRVLGRHDEAEAALRAQRAKLEGFVAEARERAAAGKGREVQMIAPSTGAPHGSHACTAHLLLKRMQERLQVFLMRRARDGRRDESVHGVPPPWG